MSTQLPPEFRKETFAFDTDDAGSADLWIDETFTNKYGDERAVLGGDSYDVLIEGGVKEELDWDVTHHKFNDQRKEWLVDVGGMDHLAEKAAQNGFTVETDDGTADDDSPLYDAVEHAEQGGHIRVEYEQKNGNGTNTKGGVIRRTKRAKDNAGIVFEREDGQTMTVKFDEKGVVGLFTGGYHPFVGAVEELTIEN